MLYPLATRTRAIAELNGMWRFAFDPTPGKEGAGFAAGFFERPLENAVSMPVPSAWNDLFEEQADRDFVGWVWYERDFELGPRRPEEDRVLRFGSATHRARVYLNGRFVMEHEGGFTPFEAVVDDFLIAGKNRLTVAVCNILDYTTLPIGNYSERDRGDGKKKPVNRPNFDFFNYAGLQRPVLLYSVPRTRIDDIDIIADYDIAGYGGAVAEVDYRVRVVGPETATARVRVELLDEGGAVVASAEAVAPTANGNSGGVVAGRLTIVGARPWRPRAAYLYTLRATVTVDDALRDVYEEPFGARRVEIKDGRFLINGESFYFKGFGKHEDSVLRGRGLDPVTNLKDLRLIKWMGGNSLRTSHYCYSEEFMRLCDREGIVVIDEVPAVGLMVGFDFDLSSVMRGGPKPKTWEVMACGDAHRRVLREMIARDKNHPCVVMWSVGNESESWTEGADAYFKPIFDLARELDRAKRPVTCVLMQCPDIAADRLAPLSDVICLNRYYGWYVAGGDLETAQTLLAAELAGWNKLQSGKPILITEYGADTVAGLHDTGAVMFTEEYQRLYYQANHAVFDRFPNVIGEQAWNFADFATAQNVLRVQGNKKGLFTRDRQPKQAAFDLKARWEAIPDLGHRKG